MRAKFPFLHNILDTLRFSSSFLLYIRMLGKKGDNHRSSKFTYGLSGRLFAKLSLAKRVNEVGGIPHPPSVD